MSTQCLIRSKIEEPEGAAEAEANEEMIDEADMGEEEGEEDKDHGNAQLDEDKQIIHSAVNENDWRLECERVANKLKVQSKQDTKEWRAHIDSTKTCVDTIKKSFPQTRTVMEKLNDELSRTLEKISKSERMINANMSDIGEQYKSQAEELKKLSAHYTNLSTSLKEMNDNYRLVSEQLETVQGKVSEHSGTMTDSSPIVKIKQAFKNMLTEIKGMDVRMGVLSHSILQYKTKEKSLGGKKNIDAEELYDLE